jgi:hypothetical protein
MPWFITLLAGLFASLFTLNTIGIMLNLKCLRSLSLVLGIFLVLIRIPKWGQLFYSYSKNDNIETNEIYSGKEFSKESVRNYFILFLVLATPILIMFILSLIDIK